MRTEFPDGYVHDLSDEAIAGLRDAIPAHLLTGLDAYIRDRLPTGGFLKAVLSNDLTDSFSRAADHQTVLAIPDLVRYLHGCLPAPSYGSPKNVKAWLAEKS